MPSPVDVANTALAHIGAEAQVASIDPPDGSAEAGYCARFYPIARRVALAAHTWSFAKKRRTLALVANPSAQWAYAYQLPSDCITPVSVPSAADLSSVVLADNDVFMPELLAAQNAVDQNSAAYEIEGSVLLTNEPEASLIYTYDLTDTNAWAPDFHSAVAQLLAGYLAGPIIKGMEGMRIGKAWTDSGMALLEKAAASDANNARERGTFVPSSIKARA